MNRIRSLFASVLKKQVKVRGQWRLYLLALSLVLVVSGSAPAQNADGVTFTTIDFPGALDTIVADISPTGDMVGRYCPDPSCQHDLNANWHGFC